MHRDILATAVAALAMGCGAAGTPPDTDTATGDDGDESEATADLATLAEVRFAFDEYLIVSAFDTRDLLVDGADQTEGWRYAGFVEPLECFEGERNVSRAAARARLEAAPQTVTLPIHTELIPIAEGRIRVRATFVDRVRGENAPHVEARALDFVHGPDGWAIASFERAGASCDPETIASIEMPPALAECLEREEGSGWDECWSHRGMLFQVQRSFEDLVPTQEMAPSLGDCGEDGFCVVLPTSGVHHVWRVAGRAPGDVWALSLVGLLHRVEDRWVRVDLPSRILHDVAVMPGGEVVVLTEAPPRPENLPGERWMVHLDASGVVRAEHLILPRSLRSRDARFIELEGVLYSEDDDGTTFRLGPDGWTLRPPGSAPPSGLTPAIRALADGWAIGIRDGEPTVQRQADDAEWEPMPLPRRAGALNDIWAGGGQVFVATSQGIWTGRCGDACEWSFEGHAQTTMDEAARALAYGGPDDVYVLVGGRAEESLHFDGQNWTPLPEFEEMFYDLRGAVVTPNGELLVLRRERTLVLAAGTWTSHDNPVELEGLRIVGSDVLAWELNPLGHGHAIYRWSGSRWTQTLTFEEPEDRILWIEGPTRAVASHSNEDSSHDIFRVDARRRIRLREGVSGPIEAAWSDPEHVVIFASQPSGPPAAFVFDGQDWTTHELGWEPSEHFGSNSRAQQPILGFGIADLYNVGGYNMLVHFDGQSAGQLGGIEFRAHDIAGTRDDLWVVDGHGTVYRRRTAR